MFTNDSKVHMCNTVMHISQFLPHSQRSCSILDPSWSEVRNFVKFLQIQLRSCETSPFCNTMELKGLKSFAVKFMIIMSRVSQAITFLVVKNIWIVCSCLCICCIVYNSDLKPVISFVIIHYTHWRWHFLEYYMHSEAGIYFFCLLLMCSIPIYLVDCFKHTSNDTWFCLLWFLACWR